MTKIALTHASGLLAEALIESMAESGIAPDSVVLLDHQQQAGNRLNYGNTYITTQDQYEYDYEDLAAVVVLQPDPELEDLLQHADCYVISHLSGESAVRFDPSAPGSRGAFPDSPCAICLPDAAMSTLLGLFRAIQHDHPVRSLQVVNILSASIFGKAAVDELASQTINLLNSKQTTPRVFPVQLAFNMLPDISGNDLSHQLQSFLDLPEIGVSVNNLVVAAFHGLCISVQLEFKQEADLATLRDKLDQLPGTRLSDTPVSPVTDCQSGADSLIYGLCQPQKDAKRVQFWIIADSVRNGLVKNYQYTIDVLLKSYL